MPTTNDPGTITVSDEIKALVERAEKGDQTALPALQAALDCNPAIWRQYGDLAVLAIQGWINLAAGSNLMLRESLLRQCQERKTELSPGDASPLEILLVDRIVACWLQVHYLDVRQARQWTNRVAQGGIKDLSQFQDRAHRRYLAAIKQLALVRKLLIKTPSPIQIATRIGRKKGPTPAERKRFEVLT